MCGFNINISNHNLSNSKENFKKATKFIKRRGPDKTKYFFEKNLRISFVKLSITDFSKYSDQPFISKDKNYFLVFNGMIYNYEELKQKLFYDTNFKTNSDSELLFRLLVDFGLKKTLKIIKGMFSFVFINKKKNTTYAATDHFGQKPLFFCFSNKELYLSSNVRSISHLSGKKEPNLKMFNYYISSNGGALPGKMTFFRDIFILPSGKYLKFQNGKYLIKKYFSPENLISKDQYVKNLKLSVKKKEHEYYLKLRNTTYNHLETNVNKALLFSGGSDSALLTHIAENKNPFIISAYSSKKIEKIPFNTVPKIKKKLNLKLNIYKHNPREFLKNTKDFIKFSGFAPPWSAPIPLIKLCEFAKKNKNRIVITGEGADEIMSGYDTNYNLLKYKKSYKNIHSVLQLNKKSINYKIEFQKNLNKIIAYKNLLYKKLKFIKNKKDLEFKVNSLVDIKFYLQKNALLSSDSYSMYNSIELRAPYLYIDFVKFILNLSKKDLVLESEKIMKLIHKKVANKYIGNFFFEKKEGTRNFSKLIFDKNNWNLKFLTLNKIIPINIYSKDWRTVGKLVNLEILHNEVFLNKRTNFKKLLVSKKYI